MDQLFRYLPRILAVIHIYAIRSKIIIQFIVHSISNRLTYNFLHFLDYFIFILTAFFLVMRRSRWPPHLGPFLGIRTPSHWSSTFSYFALSSASAVPKSEEIMEMKDVAYIIKKLKRQFAGHVARKKGEKWNQKILYRRPYDKFRDRGRPPLRWRDEISDNRVSQNSTKFSRISIILKLTYFMSTLRSP